MSDLEFLCSSFSSFIRTNPKFMFSFYESEFDSDIIEPDSSVFWPDSLLQSKDAFIQDNLENFSDESYIFAYSFYCFKVCLSCFVSAGFDVRSELFDLVNDIINASEPNFDLSYDLLVDCTVLDSDSLNKLIASYFSELSSFCQKTDTLNFAFLAEFTLGHVYTLGTDDDRKKNF